MSTVWATVQLGDILKERRETPSDTDLLSEDIRIVDKVSFNDGKIHLRQSQETKTGMILVQPGDILVSGINAAKGAIAIHKEDAQKPIAATIHYGAYQADKLKACPRFLWWMLRSNFFRSLLSKHVPGGIKTELKSKRLLPIPIPLPSLQEQQRIVTQLDFVADKLEQAKKVRQSIQQDLNDLILACHFKHSLDEASPLSEYLSLVELRTAIVEGCSYPQVGIKGFGLGLFAKASIKKSDTTYKYFNKLYENAFVVSQVKGWEGAISICEDLFVGMYVSPEYRTFKCIEGKLSPGYLKHLCKTDWFMRELSTLTKGQGARRERLRPEMLLSHRMPMPSYEKQIQFENVFNTAMSILKQDNLFQLESLMPALLHRAFGTRENL
jgi:type I restriction enzyme S subunit